MEQSTHSVTFPFSSRLWHGSVLASIAHAIFTAVYPHMAHEQSWDEHIYNIQGTEGSRGTIAFGTNKSQFFAWLYLNTSNRNLLERWSQIDNAMPPFWQSVPDHVKPLAHEALQYILQDVDGVPTPIATAAFWSDSGHPTISSNEPWLSVVEHGALLVQKQLLPIDIAIQQWAIEFEFSPEQVAFTQLLFDRRTQTHDGSAIMTPGELQHLRRLSSGEHAFRLCQRALSDIGIWST